MRLFIFVRFTIHTIEDLRKELNRRANLAGDQAPRPNSPAETPRPRTATQGKESSTPMIYASGLNSSRELVSRASSVGGALLHM